MLDSVFRLVEVKELPRAFKLFQTLDHSHVDPRGKLSICIEAYLAGDSGLFKHILVDLTANHGYMNDSTTTGMVFASDITSGRYAVWYHSIEDSCRSAFEVSHAPRKEVIETLKHIYARDQSRAYVYNTISRESLADSIVIERDNANFSELIQLSAHYGLPNGYDDLYNAGGIVELVLLHCGKNPTGFQDRWDAIMPYINQMFDKGKDDNGFAYIYDMTLQFHSGQQYYGTLPGEVPVRDPDGLAARRTKYCIR